MTNVLRSATQQENRRTTTRNRRQEYGTAYRYLRRHARWVDDAACRKVRLPIGSGATEAAGETVFAPRLKRSGMTWGIAGGRVIVDLRVLALSGVWDRSYAASLEGPPMPRRASYQPPHREIARMAA